jgi:hypothetical protein
VSALRKRSAVGSTSSDADGNVVGAQLDAEMFVAGGPPPSTAPFNHIWTPESDEQVAQWKADDEEFVRQAGRIDVFYHARQIENFVAAIKGEAELLDPGSLGLEAMEATIAMIISSETGRRVNLPLSDDDIQLYTRWLRGETIDPAVWPTGVTEEATAHG